VAGRIDQSAPQPWAEAGQAVLNVTASELLAEPVPVARIFHGALSWPEVGLISHLMVQDPLRRSTLCETW
jgi:hypothetical protein